MRAPFSGLTLATLAGLAACGGGTGPSTPPPPPPGSSAASLTVAAGDGQAALPGTAVSVKPSVRVRDAQGNAVSGATVAFVVEAGGGSVQQASVKSGADGLASPGDWTLGAGEGENRLRVSSGSLTSVVLTAQARYPVATLADTTIGAGGGTITYRKAGDLLDGLELAIPAGSYAGSSRWVIHSRPIQAAPQLRFGRAVGSVLEISGDQGGYADSLLVLRIPHPRDPAQFAMAFAWDPPTGRLEALPLAAEDATTLTVVSRHFNPTLLAKRAGPSSAPASGSPQVTIGGLYVVVVTASLPALAQSGSSGFIPGVDDWEFVNYGSYMEPGGHCAGQSVSAMWYYLREKPFGAPPLHGRLDTIQGFWPDNPRGYHLATWTQGWIDFDPMWQAERQMDAFAQRSGVPVGRLYFYSVVLALRVTGEPQFVNVTQLDAQGNHVAGHAVIAYASDPSKIWVADPNYPGQQRGIVFVNDQLGPYPFEPHAGSSGQSGNKITFMGQSAIVPVTRLDAAWSDVLQSNLVQGWFPNYRLEYHDSLTNVWRPLQLTIYRDEPDTLTTYLGEIAIRTICGQCQGALPGGPAKQQPIWLVDESGADLGSSTAVTGMTVPLPGGPKRFGVVVVGFPFSTGPEAQNSSYLDFRWINVKALKFTVTPAHSTGQAGDTLRFVAHPMGGAPPNAHYLWDFGDGSPILNTATDSTASHQYTANGFYRVKVSLTSGRRFAEAPATVVIGPSFAIDPNPANVPTNTPLTLTARRQAGTPVPTRYVWDFGDGTTLQRDGDSTATHSWTTAGTYSVTVVMKDPATNAERSRATGQVQVGFVLTQVSAGAYHSCGLTAAGAAWCWGRNQFGQLGDGSTTNRTRPVPVSGGHVFSQISVGWEHTCGVTQAGALLCWGRNTWGQLGIGTANVGARSIPSQVSGLPPLASVTTGVEHTCARSAAGQAWCWGRADFGMLGEGTSGGNVYRSSPVQVLGGQSFAQLSAGFERTCGVTTSGAAYCWGYNGGGDTDSGLDDFGDPPGILGTGSPANIVAQPALVAGGTQWVEVGAGNRYACGRTTTGALLCWGANNTPQPAFALKGGQLGDGTMTTRTQPGPTATGATSFTALRTSVYSSCALSAAGEAWCWGFNAAGEVGDGGPAVPPGTAHHPTPIKLVGGLVFTSLSMGPHIGCGITAAGETWCWGGNFFGGLGNGTTINSSTPVKVSP